MMIAGKMLQKLREAKNLSIEEVSEKSALPRQYLEEVESGRRPLSPHALLQLAPVLDIDETNIEKKQWDSVITANLGDKIRAIRENKGISLQTLGLLTDLSFTYISEIERGAVSPSITALLRIATALGVPVSIFIGNKRKNTLVGEKLARLRKIHGLSQKELANRAGLSPALVNQLEAGKVQASLKTLEKLSAVLGVSVCYLLLEQEEIDAVIGAISPEMRQLLFDPKVQMIMGSICSMDEARLRLVLNFIHMLNNPAIGL